MKKDKQNAIHKNILEVVDRIARDKYSGHFTIFSFTTHYKGCFGTPSGDLYELLSILSPFDSIVELCTEMAVNPDDFECENIMNYWQKKCMEFISEKAKSIEVDNDIEFEYELTRLCPFDKSVDFIYHSCISEYVEKQRK